MIQTIKDVKFNRAVIPEDAVDTKGELLCFGDASKSLICIAIYVRYKKQCGSHSCQLIFARSRLVPDHLTLPRAELYAALVNTHSSEVVKRALATNHSQTFYFTDSQIVLHWISNGDRVLKTWVRNRIIEIHRYTQLEDWRFVNSENMIADIGNEKGSNN